MTPDERHTLERVRLYSGASLDQLSRSGDARSRGRLLDRLNRLVQGGFLRLDDPELGVEATYRLTIKGYEAIGPGLHGDLWVVCRVDNSGMRPELREVDPPGIFMWHGAADGWGSTWSSPMNLRPGGHGPETGPLVNAWHLRRDAVAAATRACVRPPFKPMRYRDAYSHAIANRVAADAILARIPHAATSEEWGR